MAIGFARATPIQRSHGHDTIQRLAYVTRSKLVSARTGKIHDFRERGDLVATFTLLPPGIAEPAGGAPELWQGIEQASARLDAAMGVELMLSLPTPAELPTELSVAMAHEFVRAVIVDGHGLAATVAVHNPHGALGDDDPLNEEAFYGPNAGDPFAHATAMATANLHAHVMISPRQVTAFGLAKRRYTALDPVKRGSVVYGRAWGRLWGAFQNRHFAKIGVELRVTPNSPVSLAPVPLPSVRRWRKRLGRRKLPMNGRALLVNAERELENRAIVETIDGALKVFHHPFTQSELEAFYRRHVRSDIARELTEAAIGLDCVALATADGRSDWYAGLGQVQRELGAFGRALVLGERWKTQRDVSQIVDEGFAALTRTVLLDLFGGPDLVIVKTWGAAELLASDIARVGEQSGLTPVTIATPAGHPMPISVARSLDALRTRMVSNAVIIVDDADSLNARELSLVLAVGVAGNNRIVLIRRQQSDWGRFELLDLLDHHGQTLQWSAMSVRSKGVDAAPGISPPTTAITLSLAHATQKQAPPGWPTFAVDLLGEVVTSPRDMASTTGLLATVPGELEWGEVNPTEVSQRLSQWPGSEDAPTPADRSHVLATEVDPSEIEEAAFSTLDNEGIDDGIDHESGHEEIDHDWVDESEPGSDPDEVLDVYQDTELDQT